MKTVLAMAILAALPAAAADSELTRLGDSCGQFKVLPCLTTLFTDHPFHIAVASLAPGNGFGAGPALTFTHHSKPKRIPGPDGDTVTNWRVNWDGDAVVSSNQSWRAGVYMKARYTREPPTVVVGGAGSGSSADILPKSWLFTSYVETESLNKLTFYGIGQDSARSNLAYYGMRETIAGGNASIPLWKRANLKLVGEANARIVSIRSNTMEGGPSIEQVFAPASALDIGNARAFGQFGEGIAIAPEFGARFTLNYSGTFQEYASPGTQSSFERLVVDLGHRYDLYGRSAPKPDFNGPNSCAAEKVDNCPKPAMSRNLEGSLGLRLLLNESFVPSGNTVPFYFQPTLGGGNINGENSLPSYADYRFRGPNLILLRESFEHSLGKLPVGFIFMADQGKVSVTHDVVSGRFAHSFAAGLTLRAGGFPVLSILFAWGGNEGTHTLAQVSNALLGGGGRPSLY
jgi:hypothetical protein